MASSGNNVFEYQPIPPKKWFRRARLPVAIAIVSIACAVIIKNWHFLRWYRDGSNAPALYTERIGAHAALNEIRRAVSAYADINGALPSNLAEVKPFIKLPARWPYPVTPEKMLPHVTLLRPSDGPASLNVNEPWSFILIVHVLGNGPMTFDWSLVAVDTLNNFEGSYKDPEFITAFGVQRLQQLKQSAYQLP